MAEVFTWLPLIGSAGRSVFRIRKAQFGEGYAQRASDGLNPEDSSWPVRFRGTRTAMTPIIDFLRAHAGVRAFQWTPPAHGLAGLYVCEEFTQTELANDRIEITATFIQAPGP